MEVMFDANLTYIDGTIYDLYTKKDVIGSNVFRHENFDLIHSQTDDTICHIFPDVHNLSLRSPANIFQTLNNAGDSILSCLLNNPSLKFFN